MSHFKFQISNFESQNCKFNQGERVRLGRGTTRGRVERVNARLRGIRTAAHISALADGNRVVGAIACTRGGRAPQSLFRIRLSLHEGSQLSE